MMIARLRDLRIENISRTIEVPFILDANDLATLLRCTPWTVNRLARIGKFPSPIQDTGMKSALWYASDYLDWLEGKRKHEPEQ